jgi:hypothetical protein
MANSLKVEMYSESFALTAEICGLVLSIIRAVSTPNEVLIDFLLAIEYTALPCVTLALALVIKRLFGMITLHATR